MKIKLRIKLSKIKEVLKGLPRTAAERAFLTFLVLFFLALILDGFVFYKYSILAEKAEPELLEKPMQFEEALYQKILEEWQFRENRFEGVELKKYSDPFKP